MPIFPEKKQTTASKALIPVLVVGLVIGVFIGRIWGVSAASQSGVMSASSTMQVLGIGQSPPQDIAQTVEFKQFWEVWKMLQDKYYRQPINEGDLFYGALRGLAAGLHDPYTAFFDPKAAADFQIALDGKFTGIGAEIGMKEDRVSVIAPLPDTPADTAGLKPGDIIVSVDGADTTGWTIERAVTKIRGPQGTKVVLGIFRADTDTSPFDVTITRDEIKLVSVRSIPRDDGIAQIVLSSFNADTRDAFDAIVDETIAKNPKGIILDLRNDPGGFLDVAQFVAGEWVGDDIVVKERRQGVIFSELKGTGHHRFKGIPTVVLVNGGSASASEIVAGALQDYGVATLVGTQSFGKGSVQDYMNLDDGSAVKITVAEWLTPKERVIHEIGLTPDVVIEPTKQDYEKGKDIQLQEAVKILSGTEKK